MLSTLSIKSAQLIGNEAIKGKAVCAPRKWRVGEKRESKGHFGNR